MRKKGIRQKNLFNDFKDMAFPIDDFALPEAKQIVFEFGTGNGAFLVNVAKRYPEKIFVGFDIKKERLWKGCYLAKSNNLTNIFFVYAKIHNILNYFDENIVDEIFVLFPDPYEKPSKAKKRLIHNNFLSFYKRILKSEGVLHFKTDNYKLYQFALNTLVENPYFKISKLIYNIQYSYNDEDFYIPTQYETIWKRMNKTIYYLQAQKNNNN